MRRVAGPRRAAALALLPLLAACGGTASSSAVPASSGSPSVAASASVPASASPSVSGSVADPTPSGCRTELAVTVTGNQVTPAPGTTDVASGCQVALTITTDRDNEVHVHVAELEKPLKAGVPLTIEFTAEQTGVYEVELHDPELLLVKLAVR